MCEILIAWFCPKDGTIVDPFAGGPTRGMVSTITGNKYVGIDISEKQIAANYCLADKFKDITKPNWIVGDSSNIDDLCKGIEADFILSCPPYADLEKYSDDPKDLSNMKYPDFRNAYFNIITKTSNLLKENRFAAFVVGEVRDKNGSYYCFVKDTIDAFLKAGLTFYNEIILKNCFGSLPVRCVKPFNKSRKIGKTHQNVLIFVKGDPVKATEACGTVEIDEDLLNSICDDLN